MSVATKKKKQNLWRWMNCLSFSLKKANRISWLPVESRWQQAKASCWCPWHLIIACGATFHRALTKFRKSEVEEVEESLLCSSSFVLLPRLSHSKLPQCHLYAGSPVQAIVLYNKWINIPQSHQNRLVIFILMPGEDSEVAYFAYFVHFIVFVCVFLELISKFSGSLNYILIKHDPYGSWFFFFFPVSHLCRIITTDSVSELFWTLHEPNSSSEVKGKANKTSYFTYFLEYVSCGTAPLPKQLQMA